MDNEHGHSHGHSHHHAGEHTHEGAWEDPMTYDDEAYPEDGDDSMLYGQEPADPRRSQATILMVIGAVLFLFSLVVLAAFLTGGGFQDAVDFLSFTTWIWIFFGALVVLLIWLIILLVTTPARQDEDWYEGDGEEADYPVAEPAAPGASDTISLRCPRCMTIFSLQDPFERPFYHDCPQCHVRGVYSGP